MVKMTTVKYSDTLELDYRHKTSFYIRDANGDYVYFHTRLREVAQQTCNEHFGEGKYRVNCGKLQKQNKPLTCR